MKKITRVWLAIGFILLIAKTVYPQKITGTSDSLLYPGEKHFKNIRQLTFGGDNAEAYFSNDGKYLVFQKTNIIEGIACDQIWMGKIPEKNNEPFIPKLVSTGTGRTTCAYFYPDGKHILYASTHLASKECPAVPDKVKRYIWPLYPGFDIFKADTNGHIVRRLTKRKGYDAEATISPKGDKILFTSLRNGDLDLYTMDLKGRHVRRITHDLGYDGGGWFSPDGKKIVWRVSRPKTPEEIADYKNLLSKNLVAPTSMEVWIANSDGSDAHQVTFLDKANWAPNFLPDGKHIIFCSNHEYRRGFPFNMYITDTNGKGLEKISRDNGFDAFPMFSRDGKKIAFSSNRNNGGTRDTNVFIAEWVE
jgi:Tol biopolymer transport system component